MKPEHALINPLSIRPDPMPLREALRGLRFMLRRGGETIVETLALETLPRPVSTFAGAVLREVGDLARNVDEVASGFAKTVLGGQNAQNLTLQDLSVAGRSESKLAAAVYVALSTVLGRLGAPDVFVSEAAARIVVAKTLAHGGTGPATVTAAMLTLDLLDARVIRGTTAQQTAQVQGAALEPVAIFAVILWLQSTRSDNENAEALDAAADLAVVLAQDVTKACALRDEGKLEALFVKFASHV
jgi:hypothetical protein